LQLLKHSLQNYDIVESRGLFEEIESIEERVCVGNNVVSLRISSGARRFFRKNEWGYCRPINKGKRRILRRDNLQAPPESLGAFERQLLQSLDEQGISCRK
jgi:hypothetical protein